MHVRLHDQQVNEFDALIYFFLFVRAQPCNLNPGIGQPIDSNQQKNLGSIGSSRNPSSNRLLVSEERSIQNGEEKRNLENLMKGLCWNFHQNSNFMLGWHCFGH